MKKTCILIALLLVAGYAVSFGQSESVIKGKIVEKKSGEPIGFATVAVFSQDSVVVAGAMAEENGSFEIKGFRGGSVLMVSLVGYKDARIVIPALPFDAGVIGLEEDDIMLSTAVVQAQLPRTELKGDAVVTNVSGSVLEHSGNAQDLMSKVPGMIKRDGKMEVIGRGEPVYYINGRRVLDPDELRSIMSEEVRSIEVVNNPGAAYDAEIKAVVRIKTVKRQGEGFSFALTSQAKQNLTVKCFQPSWTVLDLNYRKGGLDFIGKIIYSDFTGFQVADIWEDCYVPGKLFVQEGSLDVKQHVRSLEDVFGVNWQINDDHSLGFQVQRTDLLFGGYTEVVVEDVLMNGTRTDHLVSTNDADMVTNGGWKGNMYYSGKFDKLEVEFNTDFMLDGECTRTEISEESSVEPRHINSGVDNSKGVIASKLLFRYPVWKGQIQAGAEESYVKTWQKHNIDFAPIASSEATIRENNLAGFAEYAITFGNSALSAGVRYEHVDYQYDDMVGTKDLDRTQNNWFPSASFSTKIGKVSLSASVSGRTQRPGFWKLSNEMQYHSRFTYQTGDPTLKNEKYIDAGINANWKWLTLSATYENVKDAIDEHGSPYGDEGVILLKYINLKNPLNIYSAYLSAAPSIGCWSPQYTLGFRKQFLDLEVEDIRETSGYRVVQYHKPMFQMQLNNSFRFKHEWQLSADYRFQSRSSYGAANDINIVNLLEVGVQKSFLKDNALTVRLSAYDVFDGDHYAVKVDYGQFSLVQSNDNKFPGIVMRVSYHFNTAGSKYKGTGAGDSVKNRF